ncbi:hypothetical protein Y013_24805 (plasmid) [Rhodococcus pyridinivorans SB3094]|uniref:Uncharacterized protein n=1 Tax=Rhodococcus pyridinivorans SB3094 TaxID=1435356 RepID=V9XQF8_9NOCA|nr:hypothetical protein Y013_24805 [Rhodococcus pyridinivorans SB3094]
MRRSMHTPLVAFTVTSVREGAHALQSSSTGHSDQTHAPARRSGRIPGLVKPEYGASNEWGRRRKVTVATAALLNRIVDELVASFRVSKGAAAVSTTVSVGAAPEVHDPLICAYLLEKLAAAAIHVRHHVEIEREGVLLSVRVTLEPADTTSASP